MEIIINGYGSWDVTTSTGAMFRLNDRNGHLEVRADGLLAVYPRAANTLEVAAINWDGVEVGK